MLAVSFSAPIALDTLGSAMDTPALVMTVSIIYVIKLPTLLLMLGEILPLLPLVCPPWLLFSAAGVQAGLPKVSKLLAMEGISPICLLSLV